MCEVFKKYEKVCVLRFVCFTIVLCGRIYDLMIRGKDESEKRVLWQVKEPWICFTLPPQVLTRAGFKGVSQPLLQVFVINDTPGEQKILSVS